MLSVLPLPQGWIRAAVSKTTVLAWSLQLSPLLTSAPLCSLLPALCLATSRSTEWPSECPSWFLAFPGAVQLLGWRVPSLSLQCTLTSLLLMQLAGTGVQRAWLGSTSLTAQGFGCLGFFPLRAVWVDEFVSVRKVLFLKDIIPNPNSANATS